MACKELTPCTLGSSLDAKPGILLAETTLGTVESGLSPASPTGPERQSTSCGPPRTPRLSPDPGLRPSSPPLSPFSCDTQPRASGSHVLTDTTQPGLLRAVSLHHVLQGFGQHLAASADSDCFQLSTTVSTIDDFLSHDWGTVRWKKMTALLWLYNSGPAILASLAVCLLLVGLEAGELLGPGFRIFSGIAVAGVVGEGWNTELPLLLCPLVPLLVLLFYQRLRQVLPCLRPRSAFVDKMCINQTDENLKTQAIHSLTGFLRSSKRLVVLWSPRYLTRLWCVYEIASWIYLGNKFEQDVTFVPVSLAVGFTVCNLCIYAFFLLSALWLDSSGFGPLTVGLVSLITMVAFHFLRRLVGNLRDLERQLKEFKVQEAHCFCCDRGHGDETWNPDRLEASSEGACCDRELIYSALSQWFPDEEDKGLGHLEKFNKYIQEVVEPAVSRSVAGCWRRYQMCMLMSLPYVWYSATWVSSIRPLLAVGAGTSGVARWVAEWLLLGFLVYPSMGMVALRLCSLANRLGGEKSLVCGLRSALCTGLVVLGTFLWLLVANFGFIMPRTLASPVPSACVLAAEGLISLAIFTCPWHP